MLGYLIFNALFQSNMHYIVFFPQLSLEILSKYNVLKELTFLHWKWKQRSRNIHLLIGQGTFRDIVFYLFIYLILIPDVIRPSRYTPKQLRRHLENTHPPIARVRLTFDKIPVLSTTCRTSGEISFSWKRVLLLSTPSQANWLSSRTSRPHWPRM